MGHKLFKSKPSVIGVKLGHGIYGGCRFNEMVPSYCIFESFDFSMSTPPLPMPIPMY